MFLSGDSTQANEAANRLTQTTDLASTPGNDNFSRQLKNHCYAGLWRAWTGSSEQARATLSTLRNAADPASLPLLARICIMEIDALLETDDTRQLHAVESLDSVASLGPWVGGAHRSELNLLIARLFESMRMPQRGLRAAKRVDNGPVGFRFGAAMLREQVRLATAASDSAAAVNAFSYFLLFRADPDSVGQREVDELKELTSVFRSDN